MPSCLSTLTPWVVTVAMLAMPAGAYADPDEELHITAGPVPTQFPSRGRYHFGGKCVTADDQTRTATCFTIEHYIYKDGVRRAGNVVHSVKLNYPSVKKGDMFPLFGRLHEATEVGEEGVRVRPVATDPPGLTCQPDSFPVLFQRQADRPMWDNQARLHGRAVHLTAIDAVPKSSPKRWRATLHVWLGGKRINARATTGVYLREVTVEVGDYLCFRESYDGSAPKAEEIFGHEVLTIVPPDAKTGAIGWVEFAEQFETEEQLLADKKRVRRPLPLAFPKRADRDGPADELTVAAGTQRDYESGYGLGDAEARGYGRHRAITDGRTPGSVTRLQFEPNLDHPDDTDGLAMPQTRFGKPTVGHILPVYGRLYKVSAVRNTEVVLKLLGKDEVPDGVSVQPQSFILTESGLLHRRLMRFHGTTGEGADAKAKVWVHAEPGTERDYVAEVGRGDYLVFTEQDVDYTRLPERELACKVLSVVPADAKTGVVGWVEFEYPPIPVKNLDSSKAILVRPKKQ